MLFILIICMVNAAISAVFFVREYHVGSKAMSLVRPAANWKDGPRYMKDWIAAAFQFRLLAIDLAATIFLSSVFSLGGVIGTTMGLTMSNVFSFYLNVIKPKKVAASAAA